MQLLAWSFESRSSHKLSLSPVSLTHYICKLNVDTVEKVKLRATVEPQQKIKA